MLLTIKSKTWSLKPCESDTQAASKCSGNCVFKSLHLLLRFLRDECQHMPIILAKYNYVLCSRVSPHIWFSPSLLFILTHCLWCLCFWFVFGHQMPLYFKFPYALLQQAQRCILGQVLTALGLKSVQFPVCKTSMILCPLHKVIWMMSDSDMLILFSRSVDLLHQKLQCVSDTLALQECCFWPQVSSVFVALPQYLWAKPFNRITNNLL